MTKTTKTVKTAKATKAATPTVEVAVAQAEVPVAVEPVSVSPMPVTPVDGKPDFLNAVLMSNHKVLPNPPPEETFVMVCINHGWMFVGQLVGEDDTRIWLDHSATLRRWGTTDGIGQIVPGPTTETMLDAIPVRHTIYKSSLLFVLPLDASDEWRNALILKPKAKRAAGTKAKK